MENEKTVNVSSTKVVAGSKTAEFYGEGYFLRAEGSNYGLKDDSGKEIFYPYEEQFYLPMRRGFANYVMHLYKPKTALILGCARGYLVKAFRELGVDAVGVDISKWAIENSPPETREFLYVGDICDLSLFQSETFDVTIAADVFEHIAVPDLFTALDEAARVTHDTMIINVPIEKDDLHPDKSEGTDKSHVSVYSQDFWIKQFEARGLRLDGKKVHTHYEDSKTVTIAFRKWVAPPDQNTSNLKPSERLPVDVIMLNYNGLNFTPKCIETLYKNTDYPFNLIVIDNQSTDGSAEWLDSASQSYPNMTVHFNTRLDSGYAEGINTGLKLSKAPYVCLLNNDILIAQKNWLSLLVDALEKDPTRGIVSPKLLYPDKRIQYAGATFNQKGYCYHIGRFRPAIMFSLEREIPIATFACVLIKRELLKDGLDEAYLLGTFEDMDFCMKARFEGWKVMYCPQVTLYHYESATQLTRFKDHFAVQQCVNWERFARRWIPWLIINRNAYPEVYEELSLFTEHCLIEEAYRKEIYAIIERIVSDKTLDVDRSQIESYFEGHFPRFRNGVDLAYKNIQLDADALILEYGSPVPYFSLPFVIKYNCKAICKDIQTRKFGEIHENIVTEHGNICLDALVPSSWDFIIMTEVWEHLPCSLLEVKARILNALKPGGYLLCSFPLKGVNSDPEQWSKILATDYESDHDHLRESTPETFTQFITELEILGSAVTYTRAYGGNIKTVLYRKPAE